ncbi:hypothetical protein ACQCVK_12045 [Rossellomorea vietnamensis]|uniref:Uncharacterized protein n=1 Tax=Rossellomorea aquimaris TaxID=189382 RepID=A0A5D4TIR7_9BACI|nr:hypothetical protein [Rossellomorea aquimaris]TYS74006.1 hypothetical protein FZC80_19330 [Rossellomorea aquimaris]
MSEDIKSIKELQESIQEKNERTSTYFKQLKKLLSEKKTSHKTKFISYFTYSINLSQDNTKENLLIGTYQISNFGTRPLNSPYICVKLSDGSPFAFSGKYVKNKSVIKRTIPGAWELIKEGEKNNEYWLKPLETQVLQPGESLSFSNFQLRWHEEEDYSGGLSGFFYCDENKEGTPSLNQIHLSGSFSKGGKTDESE